jgi:hypothetical protein
LLVSGTEVIFGPPLQPATICGRMEALPEDEAWYVTDTPDRERILMVEAVPLIEKQQAAELLRRSFRVAYRDARHRRSDQLTACA